MEGRTKTHAAFTMCCAWAHGTYSTGIFFTNRANPRLQGTSCGLLEQLGKSATSYCIAVCKRLSCNACCTLTHSSSKGFTMSAEDDAHGSGPQPGSGSKKASLIVCCGRGGIIPCGRGGLPRMVRAVTISSHS